MDALTLQHGGGYARFAEFGRLGAEGVHLDEIAALRDVDIDVPPELAGEPSSGLDIFGRTPARASDDLRLPRPAASDVRFASGARLLVDRFEQSAKSPDLADDTLRREAGLMALLKQICGLEQEIRMKMASSAQS